MLLLLLSLLLLVVAVVVVVDSTVFQDVHSQCVPVLLVAHSYYSKLPMVAVDGHCLVAFDCYCMIAIDSNC